MIESLIAIAILLIFAVIVMQVVAFRRTAVTDLSPVVLRLDSLEKSHEGVGRTRTGIAGRGPGFAEEFDRFSGAGG